MSVINYKASYINQQLNDHMITTEGGIAVKMINNTGLPTVKGELVQASENIDNGVEIQVDEFDVIGVMYEDGVAQGQECWVVVNGKAEVLLTDATASTRGYWVYADTADGRANATLPLPPGGTITALTNHFKEVGHCLESKTAGTNVLALIVLHFN